MVNSKSKFPGLWQRALALPSLQDLRKDLVASWATQAGLGVLDVAERDVGVFRTTRAIVLTTDSGIACLPKVSATDDPQWLMNKKQADHTASLWQKMEWFSPLWVLNSQSDSLLKAVELSSREESVELFGYHTSTIYTLAFQAVCIAQLASGARTLKDFAPVLREAYLAFYTGYRASSIAALIPLVEGALRRISNEPPGVPISDQVDRVIDRACRLASRVHFGEMWVPREYAAKEYLFAQDERVFIFETFGRWLKEAFFRNTGEYDGSTWLNRHLFAHGTTTEWQKSANFCRLVVALATLGVVEAWNDDSNSVSMLLPIMNEDSRLLWQQALLQAKGQMALKLIEQDHYQTHGRLVPEMPTDDGVTLRKAILSDDCIKDLVRPLRDAGWSVEVGEPDHCALYVNISASCGSDRLTVALLYSCATDNKIYRELALNSNVILYRGSPYRQEQYAYGIDIHVGPVAGWQPPKAAAARMHPVGQQD